MNVLVLAGRIARQPWTTGGLVGAICRGLMRRGVRIQLACQSLDDDAMFAGAGSVARFELFRQPQTVFPFGFARWARAQRERAAHDVCLSFCRPVAGDVWFPLDPGGEAWLRHAAETRSAHALAMAIGRHHGAFRAWAVEAFRRVPRTNVRKILAVGPTSAGEAVRLLTPTGLADRVVQASFFSALARPDDATLGELRARTRAALGITESRRVVAVSAPGPVGELLDGLFGACAALASREQEGAPMLLILAKEGYAVHTAAVRARADRHVRIIGMTERLDGVLAAADVCAAPIPASGGQFESGATGRFAADAMRFGRPLIALSGASGYDLARQTLPDSSRPGIVVDSLGGAAWERALRTAMEDRWLAEASDAARRIGDGLGFDGLLETLEAAMNGAAADRTDTPAVA